MCVSVCVCDGQRTENVDGCFIVGSVITSAIARTQQTIFNTSILTHRDYVDEIGSTYFALHMTLCFTLNSFFSAQSVNSLEQNIFFEMTIWKLSLKN